MVHFTRACKTLLSENNKTRLTFEKQQEKIKILFRARGLEHGPRPAASGRTQDLWHSFSQYGPPGRQIIYMYRYTADCRYTVLNFTKKSSKCLKKENGLVGAISKSNFVQVRNV